MKYKAQTSIMSSYMTCIHICIHYIHSSHTHTWLWWSGRGLKGRESEEQERGRGRKKQKYYVFSFTRNLDLIHIYAVWYKAGPLRGNKGYRRGKGGRIAEGSCVNEYEEEISIYVFQMPLWNPGRQFSVALMSNTLKCTKQTHFLKNNSLFCLPIK